MALGIMAVSTALKIIMPLFTILSTLMGAGGVAAGGGLLAGMAAMLPILGKLALGLAAVAAAALALYAAWEGVNAAIDYFRPEEQNQVDAVATSMPKLDNATPKATAILENVALITTGQAASMTGNAAMGQVVSITNKLDNLFENVKLVVGEKEFDAYLSTKIQEEVTH